MTRDRSHKEAHKEAQTARAWWDELSGDTGARARLRRAGTALEALSEGRAIDLAQRLGRGPNNPRQLEWVGVLAALLAQVRSDLRSDTPQVTARHLGEMRGERQLYAPARFRRLVVTDTPDDALIQFRRALQVLENKADIADLTHAVLHWTDRTKVRWTYAYHGAGALAENTAHTDTTKETTP